ncbi:spore coat protein CotJB [Oscillospiraceae bacterium OttesenSCG-928-G22]|nr:spore coat protein CotJB [Oscillospiraceae bacterium OttesenSCG-928-G22]
MMQEKADATEIKTGKQTRFPPNTPVAMGYVPMQTEAVMYTAEKGLARGTMFPDLDLPLGGHAPKDSLPKGELEEVMALGFAVHELALYLDSHPNDMEAFALFREYQKSYDKKRSAYEKKHGPLTYGAAAEDSRYTWVDSPWPWETSDRRDA